MLKEALMEAISRRAWQKLTGKRWEPSIKTSLVSQGLVVVQQAMIMKKSDEKDISLESTFVVLA